MKVLFIVLNKEEYLEDILTIMAEFDIIGATVVDSQSMVHRMAYDIPIFAGLQKIVGEESAHSKTIFAVIKDEENLDEFNNILKKEGIIFGQEEAGIMFTVPVDNIIQ